MFARELVPVVGPGTALALLGSVSATFTATGSTQAGAAAITTVYTNVTTGAANTGVILPAAMNPSDQCSICNSMSNNILVYPPTGYKINGMTANNPLSLAPNTVAECTCIDGNNYMANW